MGAISAWRSMLSAPNKAGPNPTLPLTSPWSTGSLSSIVLADIFGADNIPVTRAECMAIPAVARARHLIAGTISRYPLKAYRGDTELPAAQQPAWMYRTNGQVPPQTRMLWTLDDLIHGGWSLWAVERGSEGQILDAMRVPPEWWEISPDNVITVHGQEVTQDSVILFNGPFEGLVEAGAHTVRAFQNLERAWAKRVRQPIPATELHQTTDDQLDGDEIQELVDDWGRMLDEGGGVAFSPSSIEVRTHGEAATDLFVEGRNAATLDVARMLNVPAPMLDASLSAASLQYSTKSEARNDFIDLTLNFWMTPIEARLSLDDVLPRGQRTAFDLSNLTTLPQPATGPASED
jgi:phage portal protein BeeE